MRYKILIVDDDEIALFLHEMVVGDCGPIDDAETFSSAETALSYLGDINDGSCEYLILLDINMPQMNGWEFAEVVKNHPLREKIKIVMVSSSVEKKDIERAGSSVVIDDYLIKPLREEQILTLKEQPKFRAFFNHPQ